MPAAEELIDRSPAEQRTAAHRPGFDDTVWFRINIGRRQNADPRWVLPLICRRGHVTKSEIGAIRIGAAETRFQVPRALADRFAKAVAKSAATEEEDVLIELADGPPPPGTRGDHQPHDHAPRQHKPRDHSRPAHRAHAAKPGHPGKPAKPHHRGKPPKPRG
jgi:ATP-dependent RNA helicase DeaD